MSRLQRLALVVVLVALVIEFFIIIFWNKSGSWLSALPSLRPLAPVSRHSLYPPPSQLLDLNDFEYLANPRVCSPEDDVLAVILVHTHPSNTKMRQIIRDHLSQDLLNEIGIRRVFLIGRAVRAQVKYPVVEQEVIAQEIARYQDIVQGNFADHYRNLTYKHVMGLNWVTRYCHQAEFIIKMDDDIMADIFQIREMLRFEYSDVKNQFIGLRLVDPLVLRNNASKWMVTQDEYEGSVYPTYLSGWCYIAPMDAVQKIVAAANSFRFFWLDDALVTGIMAEELGIERKEINYNWTTNSAQMRCCTEVRYFSQQYYCDYLIGPTWGDHTLMARALDQFHHCYRKGCEMRGGSELIDKKCVTSIAMLTGSDDVVMPLL